MSLIGALFAGASGLNSNSQALNVLGDNISNLNTIGFKSSQPVFGDLFSSILDSNTTTSQIGRGSQLIGVLPSFTQGPLETTLNSLDLAVNGSGFFIVNDGADNFFTRAGQFGINVDNVIQNINGEILQGFAIDDLGVVATTLSNIDLTGVQSEPFATTNFTLGANLDPTDATFLSPITIFNSVGSEIALEIEFTKTGPNAWDYIISVPPGDGTINLANLNNSGSLEFDVNGTLTGVNGGAIADLEFLITYAAATPPAADQNIIWNLLDDTGIASNGFMTGFASISSNNSLVQDGFPSGSLTGLTVDSDGIINGMFSNGQTEGLFQIALANFLSPTGLTREGSNLFSATVASGEAIIGTANTGSRGEILGSVLELSNVDLVTEFISLIRTQRAFQASARVVTTADELLNEVINIMRGNSRV